MRRPSIKRILLAAAVMLAGLSSARAQQFLYPFPSAHRLTIGTCQDHNVLFATLWNRGFRLSSSNYATFFSARIEVWQNGDDWVELTVRNQQACVTVEGKIN